MRRVRLLLAALAVVLGLGLASEAKAQTFYRFAEVETIGGYTIFNDTTTFWAYVSGNQIVRGYVLTERRWHSGERLLMTGSMTPQETYDLWVAAWQSRPWEHAEVRAQFVNVDLPDYRVTYMNNWTQHIRSGFVNAAAAGNMEVQTDAMKDFLRDSWDRVDVVGASDLVRFRAQGGMLGYARTVTISQRGELKDEVTYVVTGFGGAQPYSKTGHVPPAELNAMKSLFYAADFFNMQDIQGNPSIADGIDEDVTYVRWGFDKNVTAGWPRNRPAAFQDALDKVKDIASRFVR